MNKTCLASVDNYLVVVPARAGSKGLPNKNLKLLHGRPLLAWTLEAFINSGIQGELVVSSDSLEILNTAESYGAQGFERNPKFATDFASSVDVITEVIREFSGFKSVIMLQPTSPLRTSEHLKAAVAQFELSEATSLISGFRQWDKSLWGFKIQENKLIFPKSSENSLKLRQDLPQIFLPNGAIYISHIHSFLNKKSFIQDKTLSFTMSEEESLDIDTIEDFEYAEYRLSRLLN